MTAPSPASPASPRPNAATAHALAAICADPDYIVEMVRSASLILHKKEIWKGRRARSASPPDTSS